MTKPPKTPAGLGARASAFFRRVTTTYGFADDERELLLEICRTIALVERLGTEVAALPSLIVGEKAHPAVVELRQQRLALGRLLAQLNLPDTDVDSPLSARGRKAASSRWAGHERRT